MTEGAWESRGHVDRMWDIVLSCIREANIVVLGLLRGWSIKFWRTGGGTNKFKEDGNKKGSLCKFSWDQG